MSLRQLILDEFKRGPVTVTATVMGLLVAVLALSVAWLQYAGPATVTGATASSAIAGQNLLLSNLLLVVSFSLASSLSLASLIHVLERKHPFHAMVLSVPAAVLSAFFSLVVLQLAPPKALDAPAFQIAKDLVFWATLFVFLAMNGRASVESFATSTGAEKKDVRGDSSSSNGQGEGAAALFGLFFLLAIWGAFVSAGLNKLTQLFLR